MRSKRPLRRGRSTSRTWLEALEKRVLFNLDLTGYALTYQDEFNNSSVSVTSNTPKGGSSYYYWPPYGAAGAYSASIWDTAAISAGGGMMQIKAFKDANGQWHSGNISSMDTTGAGFAQQWGYWEVSAKMPDSGVGSWPAFWIMSENSILNNNNGTSLPNEEIDIFEWYGVARDNNEAFMQQASHNWTPSPDTAEHLYSPQTPMPGGAKPWEGFHRYGVQVDPQKVTWYIDGVQTNQINTPTAYITSRFYFMIDYALGGGWPLNGVVENSHLDVDYVRVYALPSGPSAPSNLSASAVSTSQINLSWADNSNNETGFKIERATNSTFTQNLTLVTTTAGNATSYSNTGLSANTTYYYRVRATNGTGDSANSNTASATTQSAGSVPAQVTGLSATATSSSQINLSWTAVSGATSYNIYRSTTSGGQGSTPFATGVTGTTYSNSGLSAATTYYYKVAAVNAAGTGAQSAEASATTQSAGTGTKRTGTVIGTTGTYGGSSSDRTKVYDGNLTTYMDSDTPSSGWAGLDLGSAQSVNQIRFAPRAGFASRMVGGKFQGSNTADFSSGVVDLYTVSATPTEGSLTTVNVTSVTYRYYRYLSAPNGWANVAEVEFWDASGSGTVPSAPTGLSASAVSSSQINLSWNAVSGATSYNIYRSTTSNGQGSTPIATGVTTTNFSNTGLSASTTYYYKIAAVNSNGTSSQSGEASATTTTGGTIPGQVTGLSATATSSSQINLNWGAVSGATSYNIYRSTTSNGQGSTPFASGITGTSYSNTGLSASTTYYYKVAAVNAAGTGTQSAQASATTQSATGTKRTGSVIGTTGTYNNSTAWDRTKVFDGSFTTYFDSDLPSTGWAGLDLGSAQTVTQIKFAPRAGWASRMVGGKFQASNTADFSSGVVDLYTVGSAPTEGVLTSVNISSVSYRYYRYLSPTNGFANVSEVEFWG
jgi:fibronectin type 3 domain-containing protein